MPVQQLKMHWSVSECGALFSVAARLTRQGSHLLIVYRIPNKLQIFGGLKINHHGALKSILDMTSEEIHLRLKILLTLWRNVLNKHCVRLQTLTEAAFNVTAR